MSLLFFLITGEGALPVDQALHDGYAQRGSTMFFQITNSGLKLIPDATFSVLSFQASQWHNSFLSGDIIKVIGVNNFYAPFMERSSSIKMGKASRLLSCPITA
ncbi:MAG: hypothetical protein P8L79_16580 [Rhodospirillaceae bacterium]|nr:hypothetical protein [Rhodospirillaceae bacterium]